MNDATSEEIILLVTRFNDALNRHDVDAMMQCLTDDCIFENTSPVPDGTRYTGQRAVRAFWEEFFARRSGKRLRSRRFSLAAIAV